MLRARGMDDAVVAIVERHIGAGLTAEEAAALGLPRKDYMPTTLAEKIVSQADNLIEEVRMPLAKAIKRATDRNMNALADRMERLHRELSQLCCIDIDEID